MKRALAIVLSILLALPACATRSPLARVRLPGVADAAFDFRANAPRQARSGRTAAAGWDGYLQSLPVGARVKVETTDGKRYKAILVAVHADQLTVRLRTRIPEPPIVIPFGSLVSVELDQGSNVGKTIAIAAAAAGATVLGIFLVLIASLD